MPSGLHYFAVVAFTGAGVYILWLLRSNYKWKSIQVLSIIAGGCLFGIPYLLFYILPFYRDIGTSSITFNQGSFEMGKAIFVHMEYYQYLLNSLIVQNPLIKLGLLAGSYSLLSIGLLGIIPLLLLRQTRGLALASLPIIAFVYLYSQSKSQGYYIPEIMIYMSGFTISLLWFVRWLCQRYVPKTDPNYFLAPLVILLLFFIYRGLDFNISVLPGPRTHSMQIARACGKEMIGENTLIGGQSSYWYTSGAVHWHDIFEDILWKSDISDMNLKQYFGRYDAIVEGPHMADFTETKQKTTISTCYADSTLFLKGFYLFNRNWGKDLSYLFFDPEKIPKPLVGYGITQDNLFYRFDENPNGDHLFISYIRPKKERYSDREEMAYGLLSLDLPLKESASENNRKKIICLLISQKDFQKYKDESFPDYIIINEIRGDIQTMDQSAFLDKLSKTDRTIRFYQSLEQAEEGKKGSIE